MSKTSNTSIRLSKAFNRYTGSSGFILETNTLPLYLKQLLYFYKLSIEHVRDLVTAIELMATSTGQYLVYKFTCHYVICPAEFIYTCNFIMEYVSLNIGRVLMFLSGVYKFAFHILIYTLCNSYHKYRFI